LNCLTAQLELWVSKLKSKYAEDRKSAEEALRGTFTVEAEKILIELAAVVETENREKLVSLASELQQQKNAALSAAALEVRVRSGVACTQRMCMRSKAWLAASVSLRLACLPAPASWVWRSRRLRSTRAAAPGLLAHALVTKH
jgi:hypothetical protein